MRLVSSLTLWRLRRTLAELLLGLRRLVGGSCIVASVLVAAVLVVVFLPFALLGIVGVLIWPTRRAIS